MDPTEITPPQDGNLRRPTPSKNALEGEGPEAKNLTGGKKSDRDFREIAQLDREKSGRFGMDFCPTSVSQW